MNGDERERHADRKVQSYIARIRNPGKQTYARSYYAHLLSKTLANQNFYLSAPQRPAGLSLMGAQAVEMNLREIVKS